MEILDSETFTNNYVNSFLETIQLKNPQELKEVYTNVFGKVSGKTGYSEEQVKYLHHVFHRTFFMGENPPFFLDFSKVEGEGYIVKLRGEIPEKSKLVDYVLQRHRVWLDARIKNLGKLTNTSR